VSKVSLPEGGGRLIIASDGLWDAIVPKSGAHNVRSDNAQTAAHKLCANAIKRRGLRDDITIAVIDFLPSADCRHPPALEKPVRHPLLK
jgi:serine/threonine protein phosphatase PrpC